MEWWWGSNSLPLHFVTGEVGGKEPDMRFGMRSEHRQGGTIYNTQYVTYPIAFKTVLCITANASNKSEAVNLYDITMTTVRLHNYGGDPDFTKWLAFGI